MPYDPLRPGQEKKPAGKKATERRFTRAAVLFVCLLLVLYGTVRLVVYTGDLLASRRTSRDLKETLAASEPPAPASESTALPSAVPEKTVPAEIKGPDAGTVSPSSPPLPEQEGKKLNEDGCALAFNLDGGNSATLVFKGLDAKGNLSYLKVNCPEIERQLSDIIYFATLVK